MTQKIYNITDAKGATENIVDLERWGDPDAWKLIAKASSDKGKWMKSTKAMEIDGIGVVIQVTTQQGDNIAEALTFIPFATIVDVYSEASHDKPRTLIGRRVVMQNAEDISYEA